MIVVYSYLVEGYAEIPDIPDSDYLGATNSLADAIRAEVKEQRPHQVCSDIQVAAYKDSEKNLKEIKGEFEVYEKQRVVQHLKTRKESM
jgi:hypothetical protein